MQYLSAITTQASGSAGGVTASHNQHKRYLRARTRPTDPATKPQLRMRSRFATMSAWWQQLLSQSQRHAWNVYAANVVMTNALGDDCHWTGRHHFYRANLVREFARPPALSILNAPTTFNVSSNTPPLYYLFPPTDQFAVFFDPRDDWANEDQGFLLVYTSRKLSKSTNFYKGPYSFAGYVQGNRITPPTPPLLFGTIGFVTALDRWFYRSVTTRGDGRVAPEIRTHLDAFP